MKRAHDLVQQAKVPADWTHTMAGEEDRLKLSSDLQIYTDFHMCALAHSLQPLPK